MRPSWADFVNGGAEFQRGKTHCPKGHEYAGDNLYVRSNGKRGCHACDRDRMAAWRAANPLPPKPPKPPRETCVNGHPVTEFGVIRQAVWSCGECERERVRRHRARKRSDQPAPEPKAPRETCVNGHPWTEANIYRGLAGEFCRECHRESGRAARRARLDYAARRRPGVQLTLI